MSKFDVVKSASIPPIYLSPWDTFDIVCEREYELSSGTTEKTRQVLETVTIDEPMTVNRVMVLRAKDFQGMSSAWLGAVGRDA